MVRRALPEYRPTGDSRVPTSDTVTPRRFYVLLSVVPFPHPGAWLGLLGWLGVSGVFAVIAFEIGLGPPTHGRLLVVAACVPMAAVVCVRGPGLAQGLREQSSAAMPYRA